MIFYIQLFVGFILGQALMMSLNVYDYQRKKDIKWKNAVIIYTKAEMGYFVIAAIGLFVLLFVLSEFINLNVSKEEIRGKAEKTVQDKLQIYFKTGSVFLGMFIQYIAFKVKKAGKEAIDKAIDGVG